MYLIGDIGNSEIKVCLINNQKKIIKKLNFSNNKISSSKISKNFIIFNSYFPKIEKILFCSVVPTTFKLIKKYLNHKTKIKCNEIIDLGTATTFDVLINKSYKGGIIAPGIKLSLNTLSDRASLIPKINLKNIKKVIGVDTVSAVRSGFFWGYAGLIDNIVNLIKKEVGKPFDVIITGGFAELIKSPIKTKVKIDKNITIKGLIKTLEILT